MTSVPENATPPGWYADPSGAPQQRWWDGQRWTEHLSAPAAEVYAQKVYAQNAPRQVSPDTPVYTPFVWTMVLLPLLMVVAVAFWDLDAYMRNAMFNPSDPFIAFMDPFYLIIQGLGLLIYAGTVVLAFLDWKTLKARGFDRPFHWAWCFIGVTVYVIGRSVIVRRRGARGGLTPIWVLIGVTLLSFIVITIKIVGMLSTISALFPTLIDRY